MSRLHEADEPVPYPAPNRVVVGKQADLIMPEVFGREADFAILVCNGCARWQDFPPPYRFDALRLKAAAVGWRRDGERDLCPICVGN
jgi:hypothetical protein